MGTWKNLLEIYRNLRHGSSKRFARPGLEGPFFDVVLGLVPFVDTFV